MSTPILPFAVWAPGTNQNSIPANDNSLRHQILNGLVISATTTAQPGSPAEGAIYIIPASATGAVWSTLTVGDLVIYSSGTWYAFAPVEGITVNLAGSSVSWDGAAYVAASAGAGDVVGPASAVTQRICTFSGTTGKLIQDSGAAVADLDTRGRQAIYVAAGAMRPSVTGGCAALAAIASAASQPDIVTLDFDATTQEYAQFSVVMPKKWNEGTVTFVPHWSHAATTMDFGVVWDLQAVAVSNDDGIAVAFGTAQTSTDTGGTTNDLYAGPESAPITVSGTPAAEDMVFFRLSRVTANGSDTMAIDARLHGVTLYVTTAASTDA